MADVAHGTANATELRACLRNLTSLLALPALWTGRNPNQIALALFEALEAVLALDICFLREYDVDQPEAVNALRVPGKPASAPAGRWVPFTEACQRQVQPVEVIDSPHGPLRVARTQMSYGSPQVTLWVGTREPGFPTDTQYAYLVAAASLAATGLHTARLMEERENVARAKDEFLAMLGHELRNPLAPIATALSLIERKGLAEVERERQIIQRQFTQLSRLVDDLLDVARVTKGKIDLQRQRVEVRRMMLEAVETAQPLLEQRKHALRLDIPSPDLLIEADPVRLQQIIGNLLGNAAKYTPQGGVIRVSAAAESARVRIEVQDNGIGLEPKLLPRVFDLFMQGPASLDRAGGGMGIGLALVKTLVRLHGGEVQAASDGPGTGSKFTVWLPLCARTEVQGDATEKKLPRSMQPSKRILIVDDNDDAASSMALLLQAFGQEVRVASHAEAALALMESFRPTLMLIDIGLPDMDGYELASRIQAKGGDRAPFLVAVTGYGQPDDRRRSEKAGIGLHLTKPVDLDALLAVVNQA
jgi:signal transduction histidine kinase/CheY-like chemotaxis protein